MACSGRRTRHGVKRREKCQVIVSRKLIVESDVLGDETDLELNRVGITLDLLAFNEDFATIRTQQSRNDRDRGCLAGAVRAEKANGLSGVSPETDAADGDEFAVAFCEPVRPPAWEGSLSPARCGLMKGNVGASELELCPPCGTRAIFLRFPSAHALG